MFFFFEKIITNFHSSKIINFIANIIDNYFILKIIPREISTCQYTNI